MMRGSEGELRPRIRDRGYGDPLYSDGRPEFKSARGHLSASWVLSLPFLDALSGGRRMSQGKHILLAGGLAVRSLQQSYHPEGQEG